MKCPFCAQPLYRSAQPWGVYFVESCHNPKCKEQDRQYFVPVDDPEFQQIAEAVK